MTYQQFLLRLFSNRYFGKVMAPFVRRRSWTIEEGEGAGLQIKFPQNRDFVLGSSEGPVQEAMAKHLHSGGVCYDIGANMGFFSLIAARLVGPTGFVSAFEPVAENAASIRENVRLNQFSNINTFEVAVGRTSGEAELLLTDWDGGSTLASSSVKPSEPVSRRNVRVVALDDFIAEKNLRLPTFVKIDVEGLELEVMQGMTKTIETAMPILLYEVDDGDREKFLNRWTALDKYVQGLGYDIVHLDNSYANRVWNVGHTLALPIPRAGSLGN
jgi:FkbM family methyltransferase